MMVTMMLSETIVFIILEFLLFYLENVAETTLNRYAAVGQMAIESGYQYGLTAEIICNIWLALSIITAAIYVVLIIYQVKKENEK